MPVKIDISAFDEPVSKQKVGDIDISAFDEDVKKKSTPSGYSVTPLPSQDKFKLGQEVATIGYKSPLGKAIQKDKIEGSNLAGIYNTLVGSLSSLAGGTAYMADILAPVAPLPLNLRVANAQENRKKITDFIEQARSSKSSKEFEQQQSQFDVTPKEGGGLFSGIDLEDVRGLAFQAPKTLLDMAAGGVTGGYSFFAQSVNDNAKDLEDNEQLNKLTDTQKVGYLFTQATAQAALEYFSVDKILKNTGLAKSIEKKIASEVVSEFAKKGVKATAKDIENELFKKAAKLSTKIKNVGIKGLEDAFVEGSTEGIQQAASDAIKLTTNKIAKDEVFDEEDINKNFWKNIVNNAVIGGVMGGATGAGLQGLNSTDKAIRQEIANATGEKKFYVDDQEVTEKEFNQATGNKKVTTDLQHIQDQINQQVEEGNLTPEEAQAANITAQQYAEIAGKIPATVSPEDKYKIIGGISQRNKLQQDLQTARDEMMQVDPIFRKEKQDQVDLIQAKIEETNNYLEGIASGKEPKYKERRGMYFKVNAEGEEIPVSKETYDLANAVKKNDENKINDFVNRIASGEKMETPEDLQFYDNNKKAIESALQQKAKEEKPVKPVIRTTGTVVPMEGIAGQPKVKITEEVKPTEVKEEVKAEEPIVAEVKPEVKSKLEAFKTKFAPKEKELTPEEQRRRDVGLRAAGTRKDIQEANKIQPTDEHSAVLSWLSAGNKLNWEAINEAAGKRQGAELNIDRDFNSEEVQARDYAGKTKDEGMSINDAAHEIWENLKQQTKNENFSDDDVRNFLIDAVREHTSKKDAAKKLVQLFSEKPISIEEQQAAYYERQGEQAQPTENIQIEGGFKPVEGIEEFAVKEPTTEELDAMEDIVADYVKDGVTALPDIKKAIAKELGYNTKALRQTIEDAYNSYTTSKEAAPKEVLAGISERFGNKLAEMFPKTSQKPFIAKDSKSLYKKAIDLGANAIKFQKQSEPKGVSASDISNIDKLRSISDKNKLSIIDDAQKMLNTLKSVLPNFDIIVHGNEESYNKAMKDFNGIQGSAGNFSYSKTKEGYGRIDINLNKANKRTVAHEVTHGIMLKAFGDNTKLFKDFKDKIATVLKESTNKELNDFANRQGVYSKENTYEEYLAELTGMLANKETKISLNILQKIASIINDIVNKITNGAFTPFENVKNLKQVVDFFNDISKSIGKGEAINIENIKSQEELKKQSKTELEAFDKVATQKIEDLGRIFGMDLGRPISKSQVPVAAIPANTPVANGFDILKKKLGETSAKKIRENIPFALDYPTEFIDFITKTIPAKEDIAYIVQHMGARLDGLFRLSINKSIESVKEKQVSPEELSAKVGYVFHRSEKPEDVIVFKKDFANGEVLCTYNDVEGRMHNNFVFWLRRKNAETVLHANEVGQEYLKGDSEGAILWRNYLDSKGLKKEDGSYNIESLTPSRQDPYGTSSMSVQINKVNGSISIKNRYNHTVSNPDATFSNDLNNIVDGLHDAVYNIEGVPKEKKEARLPEFIVKDNQERYFKYDREIGGVYVSKNGYKDDSGIHIIDKSTQRMLDNYLLDSKNKTSYSVAGSATQLVPLINKIIFDKDAIKIQTENGSLNFTLIDGVAKKLSGDIKSIENRFLHTNNSIDDIDLPSVKNIGMDFLWYNKIIEKINLPSVVTIGDEFLYSNENLKNLNLPSVVTIGSDFIRRNKDLENINMPSLQIVGGDFLQYNISLENIDLPLLEYADYNFIMENNKIKNINIPKLKNCSHNFLQQNMYLKNLNFPKLEGVGNNFLFYNQKIDDINIPILKTVMHGFLHENSELTKINLPLLENIGEEFLYRNTKITEIDLPSAKKIKESFLRNNTTVKKLSLPNVEEIGSRFMIDNSSLESIELPSVKNIEYSFLKYNNSLKNIYLPSVQYIGSNFLTENKFLENIDMPLLEAVGSGFLSYNTNLKNVNLPSLVDVGSSFLYANNDLKEINLPNAIRIGSEFMSVNYGLSKINLPNVAYIGDDFLRNNILLENINLPKLIEIGTEFLYNNKNLDNINLPRVQSIGYRFLTNNESLKNIDLPNVIHIGSNFLSKNESLEKINLPNVESINHYFLENNEMLEKLKMPKIKHIGSDFLYWNNFLTNLEIPLITNIDKDFLYHNKTLENINLPENVNIRKEGFLHDNPELANKILHKLGGWDVISKSQVPMFMGDENGENILGFTYDNKMYLNGEKLNPNTIIHEAGHIWTEWIKNNDTKIYEKGMSLVENSPYLTKAKNSKFYQEQSENLSEDEKNDYFKHEALAMAIGDKGAQFVLESKKANFKEWLKTLWSKIKNLTGFKDLTEEEFQNLTFEEFTKKAVKEILGTENQLDKFESMKSFRSKKNFVKANLKYESNKKAIDDLDFTEQDLYDIVKSNFDLSTFKNIKDAVQKRSAKKILQRPQGGIGETRGGRKRVEPSLQGEGITGEGKGETTQPQGTTQIPEEIQNVGLDNQDVDYVGITEADINDLRKSLGLPRYKGLPTETHSMLRDVAQEMINKGIDVQSLYDKIRRGDALSNYENAFMAEYRAALDVELKNNPTKELLAKIKEFADTFQVGASLAGKGLESLKIMKKLNEANTLSNFLLTRQEDKGFTLTPKMIAEETAKFEKVQKAKKDLKESANNDIEEQVKAEAESELKGEKKVKKSHEEFVKERKEALAAAREALKKLRSGEQGLMVSVPGLNEIIAVAPHMNKYAKSLFAEGVSKLDDIVTEVHSEFSDLIDGLTKRDVLDVIAGKYNLKKKTENEINAGLRLLRREAELLIKLEQARKGEEEAKSESQMAEKSKRIQDLERKIKEVRELNRAKEMAEEGVAENSPFLNKKDLTEAEYNQRRQKFLDKKIKKLEDDLKNKNYDKETKELPKYKASEKTKKMLDKVIELEKAIALERYKDQTNKLSKWEKAWDKIQSILGVRRIVQTAVDASIWFRQLAKLTLNPRKWDIAKKFISAGVQSVFSQKNYDRLMYGIHQAPDFKESVEDGIRYNELDSIDPKKQNEMFPKSFVFKIPILRDLITASQRIADASLNVARYELYNKYKKDLLSKGITRESDPKVYEEMAKLVMNSTGSGNMLKFLESRQGEKVMGSIFYGARLMAANMNTLNPAYYVRMPKEVRSMAMKDLASYTSTILVTTLALAAAGGTVTMDPDDPEFLQVRFGGKVYDLTAGQAAYIRTFLRWVEAGYAKATKSKFEGNQASDFAWKSTLNFFRNKLAPNNAYIANAWAGKNSIGQDFDPMEIFHIYPMYADDAYKAAKEDGILSLFTVLMPNILGIGYASYYSDRAMKPMDEVISKAQDSDEMNPVTIRKDITKEEFKEFAKLRDKLIADKITELYKEGIFDEETGEQIPIKKATGEQITKAILSLKREATMEAKDEFNADEED